MDLWINMGLFGFLWVFMSYWVVCWYLWVFMGVDGVHGCSDEFMDVCGCLWVFMGVYRCLRESMGVHRFSGICGFL